MGIKTRQAVASSREEWRNIVLGSQGLQHAKALEGVEEEKKF
jgi:hypothetical protein